MISLLFTSSRLLSASGRTPKNQPSHPGGDGSGILLNGKPFRILSGELEYPREDWRDRLRKAHAMGLNAITVYALWDVHEQEQGVYGFSGQNDISEFVKEAQREGLYVVLQPGLFTTPVATGYRESGFSGPCFFRAEFNVPSPGDTYLNTEELGQGVVWINGQLLGRLEHRSGS